MGATWLPATRTSASFRSWTRSSPPSATSCGHNFRLEPRSAIGLEVVTASGRPPAPWLIRGGHNLKLRIRIVPELKGMTFPSRAHLNRDAGHGNLGLKWLDDRYNRINSRFHRFLRFKVGRLLCDWLIHSNQPLAWLHLYSLVGKGPSKFFEMVSMKGSGALARRQPRVSRSEDRSRK